MDAFISRKRRRTEDHEPSQQPQHPQHPRHPRHPPAAPLEDESTEFKLALLASLHSTLDETTLLESLLASDGSVDQASKWLAQHNTTCPRKRPAPATIGFQSSLTAAYRIFPSGTGKKPLVKKGQTLHLYSPEDVEAHTPCSIIHNFLPAKQADALLLELLDQAPTYQTLEFKLFDRVVSSHHTSCFYVNSLAEAQAQNTEYIYDGRKVTDVRQTLPEMLKACPQVEAAVNREVTHRIQTHYPNAQKLHHQSPHPWKANTALVNCYATAKQSVGFHSDQLTYLGPRPIIASLSLGVAREFRVRRILAQDDHHTDSARADAHAQIAIHLPHNSLLVMHADMQEEWKHAVLPAQTIDPHPLARNTRLNITYRCYRDSLHPRFTPRCRCGVPTVLRCATRRVETRGRYMWVCGAHYEPGREGCGFFLWAVFDGDGEPVWGEGEGVRGESD
ncbi:hypothetical protein GQ44DRAFT_687516 [Phaeosphaeriaceae sp. PMI808]|nr:hypothetical protein GQ44DRAFT_687516 [Phaeosphaeriaceae sp. PMI808]